MTPEERERAGRRVLEIIERDIHHGLAEPLTMATELNNIVPLQFTNELRNAINHLARAYCCENDADVDEEIRKAIGHIERAKRDCLKMSSIAISEDISSQFMLIEQKYGLLPTHIRKTRHRR